MTNNYILRSLRYTFDFNDSRMIAIWGAADLVVSRAQVSQWLKKDDDPDYKSLHDLQMAIFLNGLINWRRGKKEGEQAVPQKKITNNLVFKKLKIALNLKSDDLLELLRLSGMEISNQELSALFRNPGNKNYRECKDQILRNFLKGLQLKHRPSETEPDIED